MNKEKIDKLYKERLSEIIKEYDQVLKEIEEKANILKQRVTGKTDQEKIDKILSNL